MSGTTSCSSSVFLMLPVEINKSLAGRPRKNVGADKSCILGNDDSLLAVCELDNLLAGRSILVGQVNGMKPFATGLIQPISHSPRQFRIDQEPHELVA
jgi:hypothetical protein